MNSKKLPAYLCAAILIFFMVSVFTRAITKKIVFDKLGINNSIVQAIFFDNTSVLNTTTSSTSVSIDWSALYPFEDSSDNISEDTSASTTVFSVLTSKIGNLSAKIEDKVSYYTENKLIGYDLWIYCYKAYDHLIRWNLGYISTSINGLITMDNGHLAGSRQYLSDDDLKTFADSISDLDDFLENKQIPFYYINVGSKINPDDTQMSSLAKLYECTNENSDRLLDILSTHGVNTVDMRELMKEDGLDWYSSYYITDGHWTTRTGLWCASKIADMLNNKNGFSYDISTFNPSAYKITKYDNFWYGKMATMQKHLQWFKKDSFEAFYPLYNTSFHVTIPSKGYDKTGTFTETMYDENLLYNIMNYSNYDFINKQDAYHHAILQNYPLSTITNLKPISNPDKKILMICDSFSWYTSSFLALGTYEIDRIYPESFTGSIREYINQTQPDVVIMMRYSGDLNSIFRLDLR